MPCLPLLLFLMLLTTACSNPSSSDSATLSFAQSKSDYLNGPDQRFGILFEAVQQSGMFESAKTFADALPLEADTQLLANYAIQKGRSDFDLKKFIHTYFRFPKSSIDFPEKDSSSTNAEYVALLFNEFRRPADTLDFSSRIRLPYRYMMASRHLNELHYYDSYFTMLGLKALGDWSLIQEMIDNFTYLIDRYGFVPQGSRTYWLSRSQAPMYSLMIRLLADEEGEQVLIKYLSAMEKEYQFWMDGIEKLSEEQPAFRRVVRMENGAILNRYWDDHPVPRPEAYQEDVELANALGGSEQAIYRNIRAACESGWNFSSRWFRDGQYMAELHTTGVIPVDQNALLYHLELTIAEAYAIKEDSIQAREFEQRAKERKSALLHYCWDASSGLFMDYDFVQRVPKVVASLATVYPLYFHMASDEQATVIADKLMRDFLKADGLWTSLHVTDQQWDAPYIAAPLQWMAWKGLHNYGHVLLADSIKNNWIQYSAPYLTVGESAQHEPVVHSPLVASSIQHSASAYGVLLQWLTERPQLVEQ